MKNVLLFLFLIFSVKLNAQNLSVFSNSKGEKITRIQTTGESGILSIKDYKGSVYLNDYFQDGQFQVEGGKTMDAPILYNIFKRNIIAKIKDEQVILESSNFSIGERYFVRMKDRYYEPLYNGQAPLLNKSIIILRNHAITILSSANIGYQVQTEYDGEIMREEQFFFLLPDKTLLPFNPKKKSIIYALAKQDIKVNKELENKLTDVNNIDDFLKLLNKN